jgi:hypothetical protein
LSEGRNEAAGASAYVEHELRRVVRLPQGGFVVHAGSGDHCVVPVQDGWAVEGDDEIGGCSLRRSRNSGFVLRGQDGAREVARTMPLVGVGIESGLRFLLLEDGRLFRIVLRGPRDGRYELTGWETTGAYVTARPEAKGWRLEPSTACAGLKDIRLLCLMLAAEVLDAEEASHTREP